MTLPERLAMAGHDCPASCPLTYLLYALKRLGHLHQDVNSVFHYIFLYSCRPSCLDGLGWDETYGHDVAEFLGHKCLVHLSGVYIHLISADTLQVSGNINRYPLGTPCRESIMYECDLCHPSDTFNQSSKILLFW